MLGGGDDLPPGPGDDEITTAAGANFLVGQDLVVMDRRVVSSTHRPSNDRTVDSISWIRLQRNIGREINTINMTETEFNKKKAGKQTFIKNVFKGKTIKII